MTENEKSYVLIERIRQRRKRARRTKFILWTFKNVENPPLLSVEARGSIGSEKLVNGRWLSRFMDRVIAHHARTRARAIRYRRRRDLFPTRAMSVHDLFCRQQIDKLLHDLRKGETDVRR